MASASVIFRRIVPACMAVLVCALMLVWATPVWADELQDVQARLDQKTAELAQLTQQINDTQAEVSGIDGRLEGLLADIEAQQASRAGMQQRIAELAETMYKDGQSYNVVAILTSSDDLSEVLDRMYMRNKVLAEYSNLSIKQKQAQHELEAAYREVSENKDAQRARIDALAAQKGELDAAIADLSEREAQLSAQQQAALAEAAAASQQAAAAVETTADPVAATGEAAQSPVEAEPAAPESEAKPEQEQPAASEPEPEPEPAAEPAPEEPAAQEPAADMGWRTGLASAYGGSSDPSTPNPGSTATGAVCDDWSMGVAVPLAWGPQAYYGRQVEISYGGHTVVATVNDCGGMGGGERHLDLQPGVFKAFGFATCNDWGVREVQYRFL